MEHKWFCFCSGKVLYKRVGKLQFRAPKLALTFAFTKARSQAEGPAQTLTHHISEAVR